jgi:hypothetical protein
LREGERVFDGTVDVTLRGEVYDPCDVLFVHERKDGVEIAYVRSDETVVGTVLYVLEVREIARISQFVHIDDAVLRVLGDKEPYYVASDKSGSAGDDDTLHCIFC